MENLSVSFFFLSGSPEDVLALKSAHSFHFHGGQRRLINGAVVIKTNAVRVFHARVVPTPPG